MLEDADWRVVDRVDVDRAEVVLQEEGSTGMTDGLASRFLTAHDQSGSRCACGGGEDHLRKSLEDVGALFRKQT